MTGQLRSGWKHRDQPRNQFSDTLPAATDPIYGNPEPTDYPTLSGCDLSIAPYVEIASQWTLIT